MGVGDSSGKDSSGYAGDLSVKQAWAFLEDDRRAVLVDVRSDAEWTFVGVPDLASLGREPLFVPWQIFPAMERNPDFADRVAAAVPDTDTPLLFLCRSGGRSKSAAIAMTGLGYGRCFNVAGGFEGDLDGERRRGRVNGWKAEGLPWRQS